MHKALYRSYRPQNFEDVVGQEHIIRTLKNQIENNNVGHAYLFSGTRGTGKTSTAKIFARAVNCENSINQEPCNECEVCRDILNDNVMDVVEIDAASNNSVDDIRELRESVKYSPTKAKYKVYIIDEVHMLSQGAFNALLKTLEEPPSYVIFILATTEPHKIPATILSRCQRFDFKRVTVKDISSRMKYICEKEGIDRSKIVLSGVNKEKKDISGPFSISVAVSDSTGGRMIVTGCTNMLLQDIDQAVSGANTDFVLNGVNYLAEQKSKISIRAKRLKTENAVVPAFNQKATLIMTVFVTPLISMDTMVSTSIMNLIMVLPETWQVIPRICSLS